MYDTITFAAFHPNEIFQTKCFGCLMERYSVTEDGILMYHQERLESVPEEQRPYYGTPEFDKGWSVVGCVKSVPIGDFIVSHHGDVSFIGDSGEYTARFSHGKLERIWQNLKEN